MTCPGCNYLSMLRLKLIHVKYLPGPAVAVPQVPSAMLIHDLLSVEAGDMTIWDDTFEDVPSAGYGARALLVTDLIQANCSKNANVDMLKSFRLFKIYSQFVSYLRFCSTEEDQIHHGATLHIAYPILMIPCLLMLWRLQEPGHQQAWYWSKKTGIFRLQHQKC